MTSVHIYGIKWDCGCDPKEVGLPTDINVGFDFDVDEDTISDYLSDKYGWCHNGFFYEVNGVYQ